NAILRAAHRESAGPERGGGAVPVLCRDLQRERGGGDGQHDPDPARLRTQQQGRTDLRRDAGAPGPALRRRVVMSPVRYLLVVLALFAGGCAQLPRSSVVPEAEPLQMPEPPRTSGDGAIFQAHAGYRPLFEDRRPRMTG